MGVQHTIEALLRAIHCGFFSYRGNTSTRDLVMGMVAHCASVEGARPVHGLLLVGEKLTPEQEKRLASLLVEGGTVVLGCPGAKKTPARLADNWARYLEDPKQSSIRLLHNTLLEPMPDGASPGNLIVVCPESDGVAVPEAAWFGVLLEEEVDDLRGRSSTSNALEQVGIETQGGAPWDPKKLCFLHHRDAPGTPRRRVSEFLESPNRDPLTWTDIQTLLRQQWKDKKLWSWLLDRGRLTDAQYGAMLEIRDFLFQRAGQHPGGRRIHESVYEVLWDFSSFLDDGSHLFRGHRDARWKLEPTLFRAKEDGAVLDLGELAARLSTTENFVRRLRERADRLFRETPTDDDLLAVAQHYGFPTPLLDYTRSLEVGAFFATLGAKGMTGERESIGVIYFIHLDRRELVTNASTGLGDFRLLDHARIHVGNVESIEPALSGENNRIERQRGIFLRGQRATDLKDVSVDRLFFYQLPGESFEDPRRNITEEHLLPADSEIASIAEEVKQQEGRSSDAAFISNALLRSTPVPEPRLVGSSGGRLFGQLRGSGEFLEKLQTCVRDELGSEGEGEMANILSGYFALSGVRADAGVVDGSELSPLDVAIERVAAVFRVDAEWLLGAVREASGLESPVQCDAGERPQAMALACGLFIAAWETLQLVDGDTAMRLLTEALTTLSRHDRA